MFDTDAELGAFALLGKLRAISIYKAGLPA